MPGIAGIISTVPRPNDRTAIQSMVDGMTHSDAYDAGVHVEPGLHLAAGWTTSSGAFADCSPRWNRAKNICLLFAGEVYSDFGTFGRTGSETHSVSGARLSEFIREYEEEGLPALEKLNGWFAGLLIDLRERKAVLFNDRYGLGRIYIHQNADNVYFASEAKSLLKAIRDLRRIDLKALGEWISCGCVLQNRTLFPGISLLPGGSAWVFATDGTVAKQKYFDPASLESQPRLSETEFYEKLKATFPRILKRYCGPESVGMSLTGGLDGRMIMAWSPWAAGALPCYTFNGSFRDCVDVRLARQVAAVCGQPHQTIPVGNEFLSAFPALASETVYLTDGTMDVSGAAELYVNRLARQIAPVRLTGNYGSEILRCNVAFRPGHVTEGLLSPGLVDQTRAAADTYREESRGNRRSFIAFKQVPWHHFARFALERSQLAPRSPFLDNDLVALAFQCPASQDSSLEPSLRLIADGDPALARIPTDRGITYPASQFGNRVRRSFEEFLIKAEYSYDYGMPHWLARVDRVLAPLRLERLFLGRQKFCHYRTWYRRELSAFVQAVLLDSRTLARPFLNRRRVEEVVSSHLKGTANHTTAIHKLLSSELLHRTLIERN